MNSMGLNKKDKILITGSNGLLGQKLLDVLIGDSDFDVFASSKGVDRYATQKGYQYFDLDITNESDVQSIVSIVKPDILINTAALTNVDACEDQKENADLLNYQSVEYLAEACREFNSFFIHLSTDFIFDGNDGPYKESDQANPLSFYGLTKFKSEEFLKENYKNHAILRTILVFGVLKSEQRNNIVLWAKNALETKEKIKVVDDHFRMPTLAEDLAQACVLAAKSKIKGVFHISGEDYMSIYELVEKVADYWGLEMSNVEKVSSKILNQAANRPKKSGFILTKAKGILGYSPHSFNQALAIIDHQLNNKQ
jgi:dTDP-4-dehydrorhamnose reductase